MKACLFLALFFVCSTCSLAQEIKQGIYQGRMHKEYDNSVGFDWYDTGIHKYYTFIDEDDGQPIIYETDYDWVGETVTRNGLSYTFDDLSEELYYEDCPTERHVVTMEHINAARWRTTHYINFQCYGGEYAEFQYSGVTKFYRTKDNYHVNGWELGEYRSGCFNHRKPSRFFWHLEDGEGFVAYIQVRLENCDTGETEEIPLYFKKFQGDRYINKYSSGIFKKTGRMRVVALCSGPCYVEKDMRTLRR